MGAQAQRVVVKGQRTVRRQVTGGEAGMKNKTVLSSFLSCCLSKSCPVLGVEGWGLEGLGLAAGLAGLRGMQAVLSPVFLSPVLSCLPVFFMPCVPNPHVQRRHKSHAVFCQPRQNT